MARTVINLNDALMGKAKKLTGLSKKVDVVNYVLEALVKHEHRKGLFQLMGSGCWKGDLDDMRKFRT